ncbi:MAG: hypothetical protein KF841_16135 [Phycisphaerae bacterium]|nr:hypothetical protein [Phycisphaerae bacterium]
MTIRKLHQDVLSRLLALALSVALLGAQCDPPPSGNNNNNPNNNNQGNGNTSLDDLPFAQLTGNELMVEGARISEMNGDSRTRDEKFTAAYTLTPTSADTREVIINFNEVTTAIFGDITGQAHLTYEESGTDVSLELQCTTTNYSGTIEWDTMVQGTYDYIPALGTTSLTLHAVDVSSPEYIVTFSTPGCPELDSMDPAMYAWQGPGQGVWGFVTIVLNNGQFTKKLDNPLADDLGASDFYEIQIGGQ